MRLFSLCVIVRHTPFQEKRAGRDKGIGVSVLPHQLYIIDIAAAGKAPRIVRPENQEALRPFLPDALFQCLGQDRSFIGETALQRERQLIALSRDERFPRHPVADDQADFCRIAPHQADPVLHHGEAHFHPPCSGCRCSMASSLRWACSARASTRDSRSAIFCRLASVSDSWRRSSAIQSRRLRTDSFSGLMTLKLKMTPQSIRTDTKDAAICNHSAIFLTS